MVGTPLVPVFGQKCLLLSPTPESRQARSPDEPFVWLWLPTQRPGGEPPRERWAGQREHRHRDKAGARWALASSLGRGPCFLK